MQDALRSCVAILGLVFATVALAREDVKVGLPTHGFLYVPVYVAIDAGLFAAEGLRVELIVFKGGPATMAGTLSGAVEFCACAATTIIRARAQGARVQLVGTVVSQYAVNWVLRSEVAERLGITDKTPVTEKLRAMKGLTLAVTAAGSGTDLGLRYMAAKAGLSTESDLTTVYLGGESAIIAAFSQKRIDGFVLSSPTTEVATIKFGGRLTLDMNRGELEDLDGFPYLGLGAQTSWLEKNRSTAQSFLRALQRAQEMIQHQSESAKASVKHRFSMIEPAVFDAAWQSSRATYPSSPLVRKRGVERAIEMLRNLQGVMVGGDAESFYDNAYVGAVAK